MKENKVYKLNKEKQPAEEKGKYLYYFYNDQKIDSIAVDENQWEKLVALDTEMYNNERRHDSHSANLSDDIQYFVDNNVEIIEKQDLTTSLSSLSDLDRLISLSIGFIFIDYIRNIYDNIRHNFNHNNFFHFNNYGVQLCIKLNTKKFILFCPSSSL